MWGSWGTFELRVVTVNCSLDSPRRSLRSLRHLPYLWIVLGKSALHMTHPAVSPSLMFSMVQWGLYHMAKLMATQSCFVHSWLGSKNSSVWVKSCLVHVLKLALKWCRRLLLPHQLLKISYLQQLSSGDWDKWQFLGHIVTFAHHVSYGARYFWFISFGAFLQCCRLPYHQALESTMCFIWLTPTSGWAG